MVQYKDDKRIGAPQLVTPEQLTLLIDENSEIERVCESNNQALIIKKLPFFKEVDENFELEYFKPAC